MSNPSPASGMNFKGWRRAALLGLAVAFLLAGCAQTGQMDVQPRYDPMEPSDLFANGSSARTLPEGVVPVLGEDANDPALTGLDESGQPVKGFPMEVTAELVARGQDRYNIYCVPCHGPGGAGDGKAVTFGFPKPPNFLEDTLQTMQNGEIFNIITNGKGNMFPYGYRVKAHDRWAVIAYLRAMQLKNGPLEGELTPEELNQLGTQP